MLLNLMYLYSCVHHSTCALQHVYTHSQQHTYTQGVLPQLRVLLQSGICKLFHCRLSTCVVVLGMCYQKLLRNLGLFCSCTLTMLSVPLAQLSYSDTISSYWTKHLFLDGHVALSNNRKSRCKDYCDSVLDVPLYSANELLSPQNLTLSTNLVYCRMPYLENQERYKCTYILKQTCTHAQLCSQTA